MLMMTVKMATVVCPIISSVPPSQNKYQNLSKLGIFRNHIGNTFFTWSHSSQKIETLKMKDGTKKPARLWVVEGAIRGKFVPRLSKKLPTRMETRENSCARRVFASCESCISLIMSMVQFYKISQLYISDYVTCICNSKMIKEKRKIEKFSCILSLCLVRRVEEKQKMFFAANQLVCIGSNFGMLQSKNYVNSDPKWCSESL